MINLVFYIIVGVKDNFAQPPISAVWQHMPFLHPRDSKASPIFSNLHNSALQLDELLLTWLN